MLTHCLLCPNQLPPRRTKYCSPACAEEARRLWKRAQRRANRGTRYWLDHFLAQTGDEATARRAYNEYMRLYMRRYRNRRAGPGEDGGGDCYRDISYREAA